MVEFDRWTEINGTSDVKLDAQVVVVGAGPVGLFAAISLARKGISVIVVEKESQINPSPRAIAYQACTLAEFWETGVYHDVEKVAAKNIALAWWKGKTPNKKRVAHIGKREGFQKFPSGLNCGQPMLAKVLMDKLVDVYGAKVLFNHGVLSMTDPDADGPVTLTCATPGSDEIIKLTASFIIGADGGKSTVRKLLGIEFEGFSWPKEDFVASNVYYPFMDYGFETANFLLDDVNWAVVGLIDPSGLWRIAYGTRAGMTDEEIKAELPERYKHFLPGPQTGYKVVQVNKYKPHQRCASAFRKGRVMLAGDAAHSNSPIGGLGLTTGILDAGPLGRAVAAVINGEAPESLLDRWATIRRKAWLEQTNPQSIEMKRIVQLGGYSEDPLGVWVNDDVAKQNKMEQWLAKATLEAEARDEELYAHLKSEEAQLSMRLQQWNIAMAADWMAEYEPAEVVKARQELRPTQEDITRILSQNRLTNHGH